MADVTIKILTPADTFDLMSLEEVKTALEISLTDTTQDAVIEQLITRYSDVVSTLTNRVFARERLQETWRCLGGSRLYLSHWPVSEDDLETVEAPRGSTLDPASYELEEGSGKLKLFGSTAEPIIITYTGGFNLPDDAPPALKQACELMIRNDRAEQLRQATAGIRSLSHREARVMFFDPSKGTGKVGAGLSKTVDAVNALLMHYVRLQV